MAMSFTELECCSIASSIRITAAERRYAEKILSGEDSFFYRGKIYDGDTGEATGKIRKYHQKGNVRHGMVTVHDYYTVMKRLKGWQCVITYRISKMMSVGHRAVFSFDVAYVNFIDSKGKRKIVARKFVPMRPGMFNYNSELVIKRITGYESYSGSLFTYPKMSVTEHFRKLGMKSSFHNMYPMDFLMNLISDNLFETLLKIGKLDMFINRKYRYYFNCGAYRKQIFIAIRNGYRISDAHLWRDYLKLAEEIGKDISSSKYVCVENLKEMHDRYSLIAKKERKKKMMKELQRKYRKSKKRFFGMEINGNGIKVHVLSSVREFLEEGDAMHHCVFTNSYYDIEDSLIMSARNEYGERLETVEWSISRQKVIQARGMCNKPSELHDEIVNLINSNRKKIMKYDSRR